MEEPKHLIPRDTSTEDEGLQDLRDRLARSREDQTVVSDSTMDTLREREEARADHEERMHWRWLGKATRNLLIWLAALGAFILVVADLVLRLSGGKR